MAKQLYLDKLEEDKNVIHKQLTLRPYQVEAIEKAINDKTNEVILDLSMASGKSLIIAELVKRYNEQNTLVVVLTNISTLVDQLDAHMQGQGTTPSIIKANKHRDDSKLAYLIMEQSFHKNKRQDYEHLKGCILLKDEYHVGYRGKRFKDILSFLEPQKVIGFSGTPYDENGCFLSNTIPYTIITPKKAIESGYLTPLKWFVPKIIRNVNMDDVEISGNDYVASDLHLAYDNPEFKAGFVKFLKQINLGSNHTLIFVSNIKQTEQIGEIIRDIEPSYGVIHSKKNYKDNEEIVDKFKKGEIKVLINASMLTIGFDAPIANQLIMMRPTKVRRLASQIIFRVSRLYDNKPYAKIYDLGFILEEFGFIDKYDYMPQETKQKAKAIAKEHAIKELNNIVAYKDEEILEVDEEKVEVIIKEIDEQVSSIGTMQLQDKIKLYDTLFNVEDILMVGSSIYNEIYNTSVRDSTNDWILGNFYDTIEKIPEKYRDLKTIYFTKAIKTRAKNVIKNHKKWASLYYFIDFLYQQLQQNEPWLFSFDNYEPYDDDEELSF